MNSPIIAQIQEKCDDFPCVVKHAKKMLGKTNQDIADATGIPVSHLGKFFSNNLANPNLYNAVAVAIYLGISLDQAFGITDTVEDHSSELQYKVIQLENEIEYLKEDKENLMASIKGKKMIIATLLGICVLLIAAFGFGIVYDSIRPEEGFIHGNHFASISVMLITVIVVAIAVTISIMALTIKRK